jgi:hypothetical protein
MILEEILADKGTSSWLKEALSSAYERDAIDAISDAQKLVKLLGDRYADIVARSAAAARNS